MIIERGGQLTKDAEVKHKVKMLAVKKSTQLDPLGVL